MRLHPPFIERGYEVVRKGFGYDLPWSLKRWRLLAVRLNLKPCIKLGIHRRLKGFDIYFSGSRSLRGVEAWLEAWRSYYNWIRDHMTLEKAL